MELKVGERKKGRDGEKEAEIEGESEKTEYIQIDEKTMIKFGFIDLIFLGTIEIV